MPLTISSSASTVCLACRCSLAPALALAWASSSRVRLWSAMAAASGPTASSALAASSVSPCRWLCLSTAKPAPPSLSPWAEREPARPYREARAFPAATPHGRMSELWRETVDVAREGRRELDVRHAGELHQQPLQPDGEAAVRRHAVAKRLQILRERLRGQPRPRQRRQVVGIAVQPLPPCHQLRAAKQQVERVGILRP